jgi:hypothetical protein
MNNLLASLSDTTNSRADLFNTLPKSMKSFKTFGLMILKLWLSLIEAKIRETERKGTIIFFDAED